MTLRAFGSALFRACNTHAVRPAFRFGSPSGTALRALATEAGYLDRSVVTERVLEVVKKFEKVRRDSNKNGGCNFRAVTNLHACT